MPMPKLFTVQRGEYDTRVRKGNEVVVADALKQIYGTKILPLEKHYNFEDFFSPPLEPAYFESKPLVLLFGEYSTGKTSFIKYILGKEYPGMRIGPEPTTENFIVVEYGDEEGIIPGNALVVDKSKQYGTLAKFGAQFLNRFQCSTVNCGLLSKVTLVDTPGILSGEKDRGYDITAVLRWFAERCDRIILLFDINKLDISDELRTAIDMVKGYEDKIKIVLNKSDTVTTQQLMRVYGALMWSLGKVLATPEAARVYIGSFWANPWGHEENRHLFEEEEADLVIDIYSLSRDADLRKLNDLVRRAKNVKIHAYIMAELRKHMPLFGVGLERRKKKLIYELTEIYERLAAQHQIPPGDFPSMNELKKKLLAFDFNKIKSRKKKLFEQVEEVLNQDIGRLVTLLPGQDKEDLDAKKEQRKHILNKVWNEKLLSRRVVRPPGMPVYTVSNAKLSDTTGAEAVGDPQTHTRYQTISSRTTSLRTPVVITREGPNSGDSSFGSGSGAVRSSSEAGTVKRMAPSPHLGTRTIVTRTESTTLSPSGDKVVRTETTVATPEKTEVKTTETTVVDGRTEVKESSQLRPADTYLTSYNEYQAPRAEALYATIQKKKENTPPKVEEKKFETGGDVPTKATEKRDEGAAPPNAKRADWPTTARTEVAAEVAEPGKGDTLMKIGETKKETTEVKVQEKTTIIATTTSKPANGGVKLNGPVKPNEIKSTLPLNIQEPPAEEKEDKILNVGTPADSAIAVTMSDTAAAVEHVTHAGSSNESREEQRRKFLFGVASNEQRQKSEPSVILKEMKESYDQSSIKDYDEIINDS